MSPNRQKEIEDKLTSCGHFSKFPKQKFYVLDKEKNVFETISMKKEMFSSQAAGSQQISVITESIKQLRSETKTLFSMRKIHPEHSAGIQKRQHLLAMKTSVFEQQKELKTLLDKQQEAYNITSTEFKKYNRSVFFKNTNFITNLFKI